MAHTLSKIVAAVSLACVLPVASAAVLTFDDLSGTNFFVSNYQGFKFGDNSIATNPWFYTDAKSAFYTPTSPTHYIATDFSLYDNTVVSQPTLPISNTTAFTFQGAYFTGTDTIFYQLYNGANLVATTTASGQLSAVPLFVATNYTGLITSVVINGRQGYYALDDFTYNSTAAIPEPATYAMLFAGLAGVGFVARRRKQG